jgi:hypothetical protein
MGKEVLNGFHLSLQQQQQQQQQQQKLAVMLLSGHLSVRMGRTCLAPHVAAPPALCRVCPCASCLTLCAPVPRASHSHTGPASLHVARTLRLAWSHRTRLMPCAPRASRLVLRTPLVPRTVSASRLVPPLVPRAARTSRCAPQRRVN